MLTFKNEDAVKVVEGNVGVGKLETGFDFQPFGDLEEAVKEDVEFLKSHEALVQPVTVSGWVYEVETGKVRKVV